MQSCPVCLQISENSVPSLRGDGVPSPVCSWLHAAWRLRRMHQIRGWHHFLQPPERGHPIQHSQEGGQSCCCCRRSEATAAASVPPRGFSPTKPPTSSTTPMTAAPPIQRTPAPTPTWCTHHQTRSSKTCSALGTAADQNNLPGLIKHKECRIRAVLSSWNAASNNNWATMMHLPEFF